MAAVDSEGTTGVSARGRRRLSIAVGAVSVALAGAGAAFFLFDQNSPLIPDQATQGEIATTSGLRDARYCEVLLVEGPIIGLHAAVYNTIGQNDCPAAKWDALNADALAEQFGARTVDLNGPRFWTIDGVTGHRPTTKGTFGGIEMGLVAVANVPMKSVLRGEQAPYEPLTVVRDNTWRFSAGSEVYELRSPEGLIYRMQSYSHIVDPSLTIGSLANLGSRLSLPEGWSYSSHVLAEDEGQTPEAGLATVLTDDFRNTYMLLGSNK